MSSTIRDLLALGIRVRVFLGRLLGPRSAVEFVTRGDSFLAKREFDSAVADFTQAIRLDPRNPLGYRRRAATFQAIGDTLQTSLDTRKAEQLEAVRQATASEG